MQLLIRLKILLRGIKLGIFTQFKDNLIGVNKTIPIKEYEKFADDLGFDFILKDDNTILRSVEEFDLFLRNDPRVIKNIMKGKANGIDVMIMEYQYLFYFGNGRNKNLCQTVFFFKSDTIALPHFFFRPRFFLLDRISSFLSNKYIEFDSHPDFSSSYVLTGKDDESIRKFFTNNFLSNYGKCNDFWVEGVGNKFICYIPGIRTKINEMNSRLESGFELLRLFCNK